jgi:twinfilin-like protein
MHAATFGVQPELLDAFEPSTVSAMLRALVVRIDIPREMFVLHHHVQRQANEQEDFATGVKGTLDESEPSYVLYRLDSGEWVFMSFVPDTAAVKAKMLYSSAKDALRRALGGPERLPKEQHWSSLSEVALKEERCAAAIAAEHESLLTSVERIKIEGVRLAAIEASGGKVSSVAGLTFPATAEAQAELVQFASGATGVLVLAISDERIVLKTSAAHCPPSGVAAHLPASEPCYCLYRWEHDRDGASSWAVLFLYMCPEDAPVKSKMLHASSKAPVVQSLPALGIEVAKSIEGLEPNEITIP